MRMTVADLMSETPVTVGPDCSADEALDTLFEYEAPELYVVDASGRLLGVVPDYEMLKTQLSGEAREARVESLMSRAVPVFKPDTDAAEVARFFRDSRYSRIPVVRAGKLVGIVTRSDILRLMAVLRRIDAPVGKTPSAPKRPKMLGKPQPVVARNSTRTATPKTAPGRHRSLPTRSRAKVATSR
jgi:CBS domain-containing protein